MNAHASRVTMHVDGRDVDISSADRVLWPAVAFTKRDLAAYYRDVAPFLLQHVAGRPLTFKRAPNGVLDRWWFQTQCPHPPPWVRTVSVPSAKDDRSWDYCVVDDAATLLWLANLGCIELHPLLALVDDLTVTNAVVFDLDPGPGSRLEDCSRVALALRAELADRNLTSFVKTSGAAGIHVVVPLSRPSPFEETRAFAADVSATIVNQDPKNVTSKMAKQARAGKIFIDWQQNGPFKSLVAPYSLRLLHIPLVSMPLTWSELDGIATETKAAPILFEPRSVRARLQRGDVAWADMWSVDQRLP